MTAWQAHKVRIDMNLQNLELVVITTDDSPQSEVYDVLKIMVQNKWGYLVESDHDLTFSVVAGLAVPHEAESLIANLYCAGVQLDGAIASGKAFNLYTFKSKSDEAFSLIVPVPAVEDGTSEREQATSLAIQMIREEDRRKATDKELLDLFTT